MIVFNSIKYKNFLSTGNVTNEIRLDKSRSTLVVGKNGEGKCVRANTLVDVEFTSEISREKFLEFMKNKS